MGHNILNTSDGLYAFGENDCGQLGLGDYEDRTSPTKLHFEHEVISIHCGGNHTIINATDGLYVFGNNELGQLGLGNDKHEYRNPLIKLQINYEIIFIQCADDHTIINTTNGLYVCGDNDYGQLGLGDELPRYVLTKLKFDHEIYPFDNVSKHKNIKSAQFSV